MITCLFHCFNAALILLDCSTIHIPVIRPLDLLSTLRSQLAIASNEEKKKKKRQNQVIHLAPVCSVLPGINTQAELQMKTHARWSTPKYTNSTPHARAHSAQLTHTCMGKFDPRRVDSDRPVAVTQTLPSSSHEDFSIVVIKVLPKHPQCVAEYHRS